MPSSKVSKNYIEPERESDKMNALCQASTIVWLPEMIGTWQ